MSPRQLPEIPVIDLGQEGPIVLARRQRPRAKALLDALRRQVPSIVVGLTDRRTRRWLAQADNPYLAEIDAIAAELGLPGIYALNLSYEWVCTSGIAADRGGAGMVLRRTLDWPLHGLGRNLVVARRSSPAGAWIDVTWPGCVGVFTALATGRFAAAINQAPLRRRTGLLPLDWVMDRTRVGRSTALPPSHLLRQIVETCRTYAEAKDALCTTPVCLPALFILGGTRPDEGCVIERTEEAVAVSQAPVAVANHWLTDGFGRAWARGFDSAGRQAQMATCLADPQAGGDDLDWVKPPIANPYTRLAAVLNAGAGLLSLQGWERDGPATRILRLRPAG